MYSLKALPINRYFLIATQSILPSPRTRKQQLMNLKVLVCLFRIPHCVSQTNLIRSTPTYIHVLTFPPFLVYLSLQRIEKPFLSAVETTLGDRYTENVEGIYKLTIKFIIQTLVDGFEKSSSSANNHVTTTPASGTAGAGSGGGSSSSSAPANNSNSNSKS